MFTHNNHFFLLLTKIYSQNINTDRKIRSSFAIINCENLRSYITIFYSRCNIKIPEIFAINNCERASYFFGLCEYSVNKKFSIEEKIISVREHSH